MTKPSRIAQSRTRVFVSRGSDSYPGEAPVATLRVQILSCHNLEARNRSGYHDPFVIVSGLGKRFQTPVCKRNLNPFYDSKDATFDFPVYTSLVHKLGTLEFAVWNHDVIINDDLGVYALPVGQWFKGTAFAFNDRNNQPYFVHLVSSHPTTTVRGTMRIKVGFVPLPNSAGPPDFGKTHNALINPVLAPPVACKDHVGIVVLDIGSAKNLPDWPNMTFTGWDMDPFVKVSIGNEAVGTTRIIQHSRNPVWDELLLFHVREHDLSLPLRLAVFDHDTFTPDDYVGAAEINIATLNTGRHSALLAMHEFDLPLTKNPKRSYRCTPSITFRADYQSYDTLRRQVGHGV